MFFFSGKTDQAFRGQYLHKLWRIPHTKAGTQNPALLYTQVQELSGHCTDILNSNSKDNVLWSWWNTAAGCPSSRGQFEAAEMELGMLPLSIPCTSKEKGNTYSQYWLILYMHVWTTTWRWTSIWIWKRVHEMRHVCGLVSNMFWHPLCQVCGVINGLLNQIAMTSRVWEK